MAGDVEARVNRELKRFGYRSGRTAGETIEPAREWDALQSDFRTPSRRSLPPLLALEPEVVGLIKLYIVQRNTADLMMDDCNRIHQKIAESGADPQIVEAYAQARDAFEEAVDRLGKAGDSVSRALAASESGS